MNDFAGLALTDSKNCVGPSPKDELGMIIIRKRELKKVSAVKNIMSVQFRHFCKILFDLNDDDLKELSDLQIIELEKEIIEQTRNRALKYLAGAGPSLLATGGGVWSVFFGVSQSSAVLGVGFFLGGIIVGLLGLMGSIACVCCAWDENSYRIGHKTLKEAVKLLNPEKKDAEEKFTKELLDALRNPST